MPRTSGTWLDADTSGTKSKAPTKGSTCRQWVFTLNNYKDKDIRKVHNPPDYVRYLAYSKEVGKKCGTPHLQGFIYCHDKIRMTQLTNWFGGKAHLEEMQGNFMQNELYCSKQGKLIEVGERPQQGRRNDILGFKRRLDDGTEFEDVLEDEAFFAIGMRNERSLRNYANQVKKRKLEQQPRAPPLVFLLMGESGHGKTPTIKKLHGAENCYSVFDTKSPWYENYRGQKIIIFEDIDSTSAPPLKHFKDICDGYVIDVPIKGRSAPCLPTHVYITSNEHPSNWYPGKDKHYNAVKNRFDQIWDFNEKYPYGVYKVIYRNENRRGNVLPEQQELIENADVSSKEDEVESDSSEVSQDGTGLCPQAFDLRTYIQAPEDQQLRQGGQERDSQDSGAEAQECNSD